MHTFGPSNDVATPPIVSVIHAVVVSCASHPLLDRSSPVAHDGAAGPGVLNLWEGSVRWSTNSVTLCYSTHTSRRLPGQVSLFCLIIGEDIVQGQLFELSHGGYCCHLAVTERSSVLMRGGSCVELLQTGV
jgi:hypothetical protein